MKPTEDPNEVTTITPEEGVIVNFTMHVSKSVSSSLLEQELTRALQLTHMKVGDSALLAAPLSQSVRGIFLLSIPILNLMPELKFFFFNESTLLQKKL